MSASPLPPNPNTIARASEPLERFEHRHIGPSPAEQLSMLQGLGVSTLDALTAQAVPPTIALERPMRLPEPLSESEARARLVELGRANRPLRSLIGMGYSACDTPSVIRRNILENPGWYTQYTPYQAEIAQGRLEALMVFQTMVSDLTGLPCANASLLDEATAAAEAMILSWHARRTAGTRYYVDQHCHPQVIAVLQTRATPLGLQVVVGAPHQAPLSDPELFGILLAYPSTRGALIDYTDLCTAARAAQVTVAACTDLLALTLIKAPGEFGVDIAVGSAQRFGVPMGYGGPHAAFIAVRDELKRLLPGRIVGQSVDSAGKPAYRLALQTREQHIRRDRATSNICTAQVLLAIVAALYAVYHGPEGLTAIARRVHDLTSRLARGLLAAGYELETRRFFDTLSVEVTPAEQAALLQRARESGFNLRHDQPGRLGISLDERSTSSEVEALLSVFGTARAGRKPAPTPGLADSLYALSTFERHSSFLTHSVFHRYRSEHELLRYMRRLESYDLSLTRAMIPLGSCTMKLNGTTELEAITAPDFAELHPFVPDEQAQGYARLFADLEAWLCEITGMDAVSLQPNAGAQGEYAGLLAMRAFHESRGQAARKTCLIPTSAHGTNPASATLAGLRVVQVACDSDGNVDIEDLRAKADSHASELCGLMLTYPSTHGVFETQVRALCDVIHGLGGLVYLDGANMNAQVGLCRPGDYGADVCHLNLHKTFCIPHGGGGPGMGPIAVKAHLAPFLPAHPLRAAGAPVGPVSAAPYGSASILTIPWTYIALMGGGGLRRATQVAILNANYMAARLQEHYPVLFRGAHGRVAHEFIIDLRPFKRSAGVEVDDVAKRLMDYGFHSPTMSFPVPGTLMIEPTESEAQTELDRLCDALIAIRQEIAEIEQGRMPLLDSPLRRAPHTALSVTSDDWHLPYTRQHAAFPTEATRLAKYWPPVGRVDGARGDRQLVCVLQQRRCPD